MKTAKKIKAIVEETAYQKISDTDLTKSWKDLDIDSLGLVQLMRDVEDEFSIELDYDIFKKVNSPSDLVVYLEQRQP